MIEALTQNMDMNLQQARSAEISEKLKSSRKMEQITETAKEFEAVFLAEMIKPMFEGINTEPPFGGGKGEEVFRGLLIQEYGKMLAQTGRIGIAEQVKQEMIKLQENS